MEDERHFLTIEQAQRALLDEPHSFIQGGMALIGCDLSRERAEEKLRDADSIEIAGPFMRRMKHGLALVKGGAAEFLSASEEVLSGNESAKTTASEAA